MTLPEFSTLQKNLVSTSYTGQVPTVMLRQMVVGSQDGLRLASMALFVMMTPDTLLHGHDTLEL
jgi:hypothetical protein